jgi:hypothetical protein
MFAPYDGVIKIFDVDDILMVPYPPALTGPNAREEILVMEF